MLLIVIVALATSVFVSSQRYENLLRVIGAKSEMARHEAVLPMTHTQAAVAAFQKGLSSTSSGGK